MLVLSCVAFAKSSGQDRIGAVAFALVGTLLLSMSVWQGVRISILGFNVAFDKKLAAAVSQARKDLEEETLRIAERKVREIRESITTTVEEVAARTAKLEAQRVAASTAKKEAELVAAKTARHEARQIAVDAARSEARRVAADTAKAEMAKHVELLEQNLDRRFGELKAIMQVEPHKPAPEE